MLRSLFGSTEEVEEVPLEQDPTQTASTYSSDVVEALFGMRETLSVRPNAARGSFFFVLFVLLSLKSFHTGTFSLNKSKSGFFSPRRARDTTTSTVSGFPSSLSVIL